MNKVAKITISYTDGSVWFTDNPTEIRAVGLSLPKGIKWNKGASEEILRNVYFNLLTEIVKNVKPGYNKTDLHESLKPMLLQKLKDFPQYFKDGKPGNTTTNLTRDGWIAIIEQLKETANDVFNYTFVQ